MSTSYSCCRNYCVLISVIFSVIVGVATTILALTGTVVLAPIFTISALIVAVAYLTVLLLASPALRTISASNCTCSTLTALLVAIFGVLISGIVTLAFAFVATSAVGAVFNGALLLFLTLLLTSTACLVKQTTRCE